MTTGTVIFILSISISSNFVLSIHISKKINQTDDNNSILERKGLLSVLPDSLKDEIYFTVPEIISKYKYPSETHHVITDDGYILTMHRIPHGKNKNSATKGAMLVMHGILASSADWIITGPYKGLGYLLADEGYDVWLGNARGNYYSHNHTKFSVQSEEFWDFSWHEIGLYDIPAMIDHILLTTDQKQIFHIAHSQGSTAFYVLCSQRPEYNNKIKAHFSLAPIGYVGNVKSPIIKLLARVASILKTFTDLLKIREILPRNGLISQMGQLFCGYNDAAETVCKNVLFSICGFDPQQLNSTLLPLILAHVPAGSSAKQFLHYAQEINSGYFRQYDYGIFGNFKHYGSWRPPSYDLSKITVPLYLFHSKNDWISSPQDVYKLSTYLQNVQGNFWISDNKFNHLDFLFGIDAPKVLYYKIISLMTRH